MEEWVMRLTLLSLILLANWTEEPAKSTGTIRGVVTNGTRGNEPMDDVVVALRAGNNESLETVAETRTDYYGKFAFEGVPLDPAISYLPGAERDGIHYPGERVRLDVTSRFAHVPVVVFDAVKSPSPLIARRHDIDVNIRQEVVEVSESLLIVNSERVTYVGTSDGNEQPVTFRLSIPPSFDRVTFGSEFYGRRFWIADRQPVTDIPWPPGERELKFKYRMPLDVGPILFRRLLDVPCADLRLRVRGAPAEHVTCSLPLAMERHATEVIFTSNGEQLSAGNAIELQIDTGAIPWLHYARWGSLATLAALSLATMAVLRQSSDAASERAGPTG